MKLSVRSLVFYIVLLLLTLACIEASARAAYYILYGTGYQPSKLSVDAGLGFLETAPDGRALVLAAAGTGKRARRSSCS